MGGDGDDDVDAVDENARTIGDGNDDKINETTKLLE